MDQSKVDVFSPGWCVAGLILVLLVKPGVGQNDPMRGLDEDDDGALSTLEALMDLFSCQDIFSLHIFSHL